MEGTRTNGSQYFWLNRHSVLAMSFVSALSVNATPQEPKTAITVDSGISIQIERKHFDTLGTDKVYVFTQKKNFRERYRRISKSEWFKRTHSGMSIGDVIFIEE